MIEKIINIEKVIEVKDINNKLIHYRYDFYEDQFDENIIRYKVSFYGLTFEELMKELNDLNDYFVV